MTVEGNGTTTTTTTTTSSSDSGLSGGAIAGIVVGSVVFVAGLVLLIVFLVKRAKAKRLLKTGSGRASVLQDESTKKNQVSPIDDSSSHHIPTEQRLDVPDVVDFEWSVW